MMLTYLDNDRGMIGTIYASWEDADNDRPADCLVARWKGFEGGLNAGFVLILEKHRPLVGRFPSISLLP